jgi:hypothetical protein
MIDHHRGPDVPVLVVLYSDEETTLDPRRESDDREGEGEGAEGVDGLRATEGRSCLRLPRTEGNREGGGDGVPVLRSRGSSTRGGRRPDPDEGGSFALTEYPIWTCVLVC